MSHLYCYVPTLRFKTSCEWNEYKLKEISKIFDGTHQTPEYKKQGISFVSVEDINNLYATSKFITEDAFAKDFKVYPEKNDILMTRIGDIGTPAVVTKEQPLAYYVSLALIKPLNNLDSMFAKYMIESRNFQHELWKRTIHVAFPKKINKEEIGECLCFVPNIKTQQKIGHFLLLIDERIATQNKIIEDLKLLMKRSIDSLLHSKLQAKNIELRQLLTERKDKNKFALSVFSVAVEEGIVNQEEHLGRSFAAKDTSNYNVVKYGDVVYTKSPTGLFPFGIVKQSFNKEDVAVSPLYGIYEPKTMAVGNYLHYYFLNPINANNYLHPLVNKGAKNTMNITNQRFLDGKIAFPESYIESLVGFLNSIKTKFDFNVKLLEKYLLQKKYLLDNLFI